MIAKFGQSIIAFLLATIVAMLGWFLPYLANKVDVSMEREQDKLNQIYQIKSSVLGLNNKVHHIDEKMIGVKKKNEYIYKNITDRLDIMASDIKATKRTSKWNCATLQSYAKMMNWDHQPKCKIAND